MPRKQHEFIPIFIGGIDAEKGSERRGEEKGFGDPGGPGVIDLQITLHLLDHHDRGEEVDDHEQAHQGDIEEV